MTDNDTSLSSVVVDLTVSVVLTVRNDRTATEQTLQALADQTRLADEVIVVDGGSTDGTVEVVRRRAAADRRVKLIEAFGANISTGRNIGIRAARGEIIATTDAGCRLAEHWLEELVRPFADDARVEFVAGCYEVEGRTLLEQVVGLATMRGQLEPVDPRRFNPSARSMAFTKSVWERAGGFPEWVRYSEDTLFDHKMRAQKVVWRFAPRAIVYWRPRTSLRSIARQFFNYGTGRGHTQIDGASFRYNLRNLVAVGAAMGLCLWVPWAAFLAALLWFYCYVVAFHARCTKVALRLGRRIAYVVCLVVMWTVLLSNTLGYAVGSIQRLCDRGRYRHRLAAYLAPSRVVSTRRAG